MGSGTYRVQVLSLRALTADVHELILTLIDPPKMSFLPGQAIAVHIPTASGLPKVRYYSIASPPSASHEIRLLFNQGEEGQGAHYFLRQAVGDVFEIEGPFGAFHLHDNPGHPLVFVAMGTGIAPIRSMIATLLEQQTNEPITVLWGVRHEADIFYWEEFREWATRFPNVSVMITLSKPNEAWHGLKGRVTQILEGMPNPLRCAAYVCGGRKMVAEVVGLLRQRGASHIYREQHHVDP